MSSVKLIGTLICVMLISACTPQNVRTTQYNVEPTTAEKELALEIKDALWVDRYLTLSHQDSYSFDGRLSVRQGGKYLMARMDAVVKGDNIVIDLKGPLSLGRVRLIINEPKKIYSLLTSKGLYQASSLEELSRSAFKIVPPIQQLMFWLRGIPQNSAVKQMSINKKGEVISFLEQGFAVSLKDYKLNYNFEGIELSMPRKIRVENESVTVKLVVDHFFPQ